MQRRGGGTVARGGRASTRHVALVLALTLLLGAVAQLVTAGEWLGCVRREPGSSAMARSRLSGADPYPSVLVPQRRLRRPTPQRRVLVAVVDDGVDPAHADVRARRVGGVDLVDPCGGAANDPTGHGTAVAAVLASALDDHERDVPGARVQIMPVRVSSARGDQPRWSTALAVLLAVRRGADVINLSASSHSSRPSIPEALAIRHAVRRGVVVVAAAGNRPDHPARYPASYRGVISVTASAGDGSLAAYATHTGRVDVAARGTRRWRDADGGAVRTVAGTSFAAPVVAAAAALLRAHDPTLSPARIAHLLEASARPMTDRHGERIEGLGEVEVSRVLRAVVGARLAPTTS